MQGGGNWHLAGLMPRSCGFESRPCDVIRWGVHRLRTPRQAPDSAQQCSRGGTADAAGSDPAPDSGVQVRLLPGVLERTSIPAVVGGLVFGGSGLTPRPEGAGRKPGEEWLEVLWWPWCQRTACGVVIPEGRVRFPSVTLFSLSARTPRVGWHGRAARTVNPSPSGCGGSTPSRLIHQGDQHARSKPC